MVFVFLFFYPMFFLGKKTSDLVKYPLNADEIVTWCREYVHYYTLSAMWMSVIQRIRFLTVI